MAIFKSYNNAAFASLLAIFLLACLPDSGNARSIIVGGDNHWKFGFNYMEWAFKTGPFYINDSLVFKYEAPTANTFPHNVYLMKNYKSFLKCDFTNATLIGAATHGAGQGVSFTLTKKKNYFFGCSVRNGTHCRDGLMRFFVYPVRPCSTTSPN